ncbi:hypothetical protein Ga0074812_11422 [Parafrankia irregularis]|uniref:Uncharacterized protein n=1 Tax=Parafrankia irregularis TaxID=795642 RepID=A0A0S4QS76_9ACTN|nr:hypothetical protein Ga0074812_11422 [Parafrankia irregularis]
MRVMGAPPVKRSVKICAVSRTPCAGSYNRGGPQCRVTYACDTCPVLSPADPSGGMVPPCPELARHVTDAARWGGIRSGETSGT